MNKQQDNRKDGFGVKLELRRQFCRDSKIRPLHVLDCCSGQGLIWKTLAKEFPMKVLRLDQKKISGTVKINSKRFLSSQDLRKYNIVDIDTYGEPFDHYLRLKNNPLRHDLIVFLTYGFISQGIGQLSNKVKDIIGIPNHWNLDAMYGEALRNYAISVILQGVMDCKQAIISNKIYYIGFKLEGSSCQ